MEISNIQGQDLPAPISLESALLELSEIASLLTTPETEGQAVTIYSDDTCTITITLPISQTVLYGGQVAINTKANSFPPPIGS